MPKKTTIADTAGNSEKEGPRWKAFLGAYLSLGHFGKACQAVGANHSTIRKLLKKIPEFGEAFADAEQVVADKLEDALRQRAVEGWDRLKFDKNGQACLDPRTGNVYEEKQFSDLAAIFLLKGQRPEKYREKFEHVGRGGGPIETSITNMADLVKLANSKPEEKK